MTFERKFPTLQSVAVRDFNGNPAIKDVRAEVVEESLVDKTLVFGIQLAEDHWYVFSATYVSR